MAAIINGCANIEAIIAHGADSSAGRLAEIAKRVGSEKFGLVVTQMYDSGDDRVYVKQVYVPSDAHLAGELTRQIANDGTLQFKLSEFVPLLRLLGYDSQANRRGGFAYVYRMTPIQDDQPPVMALTPIDRFGHQQQQRVIDFAHNALLQEFA